MMTSMLTVENIVAGSRVYNIWNVNEDAEYHEAGDEGEQQVIAATKVTEDQAAALTSERDVPKRIEKGEAPRKAA
jgi:hypothetical protein